METEQISAEQIQQNNSIIETVPSSEAVDQFKKKKRTSKAHQSNLSSIEYVGGIKSLDQSVADKIKKKFSIDIRYRVSTDDKLHHKTVKFGKITDKDYLDHKNVEKKNALLKKLNLKVSPLSPKWWRIYILNNLPNIQSSYNDACERLCKDFKLYSSTTIYGQKY